MVLEVDVSLLGESLHLRPDVPTRACVRHGTWQSQRAIQHTVLGHDAKRVQNQKLGNVDALVMLACENRERG